MTERADPSQRLTLRLAGRHDVVTITALVRQAFEPYVPLIGREPAPMTHDYAEVVRAGQTWISQDETGHCVGVLVLVPEPDHLVVETLAVATDRRGQGVGALLLRAAETQALEAGLSELRLCTNLAMTRNLAYYPHQGFTETHRAEQDGYQRVFFRKTLQPSPSRLTAG